MTNTSAILLPGESGGAEAILFTPARRWVEAACADAGVRLTAAPTDTAVLFLDADRPLIQPETIQSLFPLRQELSAAVCGEEIIAVLAARAVLDTLPDWQSMRTCRDLASAARGQGRNVETLPVSPEEALRVGTPLGRLRVTETARRRIAGRLMEGGVEFLSMDGILISPDCRVGKGTQILPGTILREGSVIGENCVIGPNSVVTASTIGDNVVFNASQCTQSEIGAGVSVGPFSHLRPGSRIESGVHIGDFVEVKNSVIGADTHISHLTYVGDSDVGQRVNFGCGVATANYNGVSKSRCTIGDDAFIGCNTNLVAPVTVGPGGYTAAGSTITEEVPSQALAIARARQVNKPGYNHRLRG